MVAISGNYKPPYEIPFELRTKGLESLMGEFFSRVGKENGVNSLDSYKRFADRATRLATRFTERGIPIEVNMQKLDDGSFIISADAKFPSGHREPYLQYYTGRDFVYSASDSSSPYEVMVGAIMRNGVLKGWHEAGIAEDILYRMDELGNIYRCGLILSEDVEISRKLFRSFEVHTKKQKVK
jgi:hypothetical protein